jgi:hypothetical protein
MHLKNIFSNLSYNIVTCISDCRWGFGLDAWIYCTLYIHTIWDYRQYNAIAILHTFSAHALGFPVFTSRLWQRISTQKLLTDSLDHALQILHINKVLKSQLKSHKSTNFLWLSPTENSELLSLAVTVTSSSNLLSRMLLPLLFLFLWRTQNSGLCHWLTTSSNSLCSRASAATISLS